MSTKQYDEVCRDEFVELNRKLDEIAKQLYYDNGGQCIQSRLNKIDTRNSLRDKLVGLIIAGVFIPLLYHIALKIYTVVATL